MSSEGAIRKRRGRPKSMAGWLMQRVTGIFLVYALGVHLWTVHVVDSGRLNWEVITARLQDGTMWSIYYLLFIPAVIFHAANGIWGITMDYNPNPSLRQRLLMVFWAVGLLILVFGYFSIRPLLGQGVD